MRYLGYLLLIAQCTYVSASSNAWQIQIANMQQGNSACELNSDEFTRLYLEWMSEEPYSLIDGKWQNRARAINFYPLPRGVVSRKLRQYQRSDDKRISLGLSGLQTLGYLLKIGSSDCQLKEGLVSELDRHSAAWLTAKAGLTIEQRYSALVNGIDLNTRVRIASIMEDIDRSPAYVAEGFTLGLDRLALQRSVKELMLLEELLTSGIPYPTLESKRRSTENDMSRILSIESPSKFHLEVLGQRLEEYRQTIEETIGKALGISTGFNALDGD